MENFKLKEWSEWKKFPNPKKGEYLIAPFGKGVYELKNRKTGELILFGESINVAYRMTSLLPPPEGQGGRKNTKKKEYVRDNINDIEYRTIPFDNKKDMNEWENNLKKNHNYKFNT